MPKFLLGAQCQRPPMKAIRRRMEIQVFKELANCGPKRHMGSNKVLCVSFRGQVQYSVQMMWISS